MAHVDINRVLETCIKWNAREVWLLADRPPVLRFDDNVRDLQVPALGAEDVPRLAIHALAPDFAAQYRDRGFCTFHYSYPWPPHTKFRVFVIKHGGAHFASLTPFTVGVAPLELQRSLREFTDAGEEEDF